jgi:hypothetical protein
VPLQPYVVIAAAPPVGAKPMMSETTAIATWSQVTAMLLEIKITLAAQDNFPSCITLSFPFDFLGNKNQF